MSRISVTNAIGRRQLILAALAGVAATAFGAGSREVYAGGEDTAAERSQAFLDALKQICGDRVPEEALATLTLPERAENGNIVPYTVAVESPMTDADFVASMHLLSTSNPQPRVATFHLTPRSGKAMVSGRMRLARTQDVVMVAETSAGKLLMATRRVEVELGGCGN